MMDKTTADNVLLQEQAARLMDGQEFLTADRPSREDVLAAVAVRHQVGPETMRNMTSFDLDYMFINLEPPAVVALV